MKLYGHTIEISKDHKIDLKAVLAIMTVFIGVISLIIAITRPGLENSKEVREENKVAQVKLEEKIAQNQIWDGKWISYFKGDTTIVEIELLTNGHLNVVSVTSKGDALTEYQIKKTSQKDSQLIVELEASASNTVIELFLDEPINGVMIGNYHNQMYPIGVKHKGSFEFQKDLLAHYGS